MTRIIIMTGGLGYIGTELCKIYSGVSWHHKIVVLDNEFISERVNQIKLEHGIHSRRYFRQKPN